MPARATEILARVLVNGGTWGKGDLGFFLRQVPRLVLGIGLRRPSFGHESLPCENKSYFRSA